MFLNRIWYPSRISHIVALKSNKRRLLRSILRPEIEDDVKHLELTTKQFLTMAMLYQTNVYYMIQLIEMLKQISGIVVFISTMVLQLIIGIPMLTLFTFLSSYSKKSFLKFWDCLPILRGIGYTILFTRFLCALYYAFFSSIALICMIDIAIRPNILTTIGSCKYDNRNMCLPMYPKAALNLTCPTPLESRNQSEYVLFSTQYYFRYKIMEYDVFNRREITGNSKLVVTVFFLWCTIFVITILGIRRIRKVTLAVQYFLDYLALITAFVALFGSHKDVMPYKMNLTATPNFTYWVFILLHSADPFILSDMIWVGIVKPKALSAKNAGCIIGLVKTLTILIIIFCSKRSAQMVIGHYKITDTRCLVVYGFEIMFSFIPDVLYRVYFGIFFSFIWYMFLFWSTLTTTVYTVASIINALMENFARLRNYRIFLYIAYCILSFISDLFFCTNFTTASLYIFHYYGAAFLTIVGLVSISLGIFYIYSIGRIVEDYLFSHGKYPKNFFVMAWKITTTVALFTLVYMLIHLKYYAIDNFPNYRLMILAFLKTIIFLLPIFVLFGVRCYSLMEPKREQSILSRIHKATLPSKKWGPPEENERKARKAFLPRRALRYYQTEINKCNHNCMLLSEKFEDENHKQMLNLEAFQNKIELQTETEEIEIIIREIKWLTKAKRVKT